MTMDPDLALVVARQLLPFVHNPLWVGIAAFLIGFVTRILKGDQFVLPPRWHVSTALRRYFVVLLGLVSALGEIIFLDAPWRWALLDGALSAVLSFLGHAVIVDLIRKGRDIGVPKDDDEGDRP